MIVVDAGGTAHSIALPPTWRYTFTTDVTGIRLTFLLAPSLIVTDRRRTSAVGGGLPYNSVLVLPPFRPMSGIQHSTSAAR